MEGMEARIPRIRSPGAAQHSLIQGSVIASEKMHTQIWTLAEYICGLSAQVMPISHLNCIAETTARTRATKKYNDTQTHTEATWAQRDESSGVELGVYKMERRETYYFFLRSQLFSPRSANKANNIASAQYAKLFAAATGVLLEIAIISPAHKQLSTLWNGHKYFYTTFYSCINLQREIRTFVYVWIRVLYKVIETRNQIFFVCWGTIDIWIKID